MVCVTLKPFGIYSGAEFSVPVLIALLVCLIPTTIGGLLSAIGISGIDRLIRRNVMATSGRAVEAAGDVDVLLLDKTGTITLGNRMATAFVPAPASRRNAGRCRATGFTGRRNTGRPLDRRAGQADSSICARVKWPNRTRKFIPFTAQTRMSGVDFEEEPLLKPRARDGHHGGVAVVERRVTRSTRSIRKGAADAMQTYVTRLGGSFPKGSAKPSDEISRSGGTPLVVAEGSEVLGVIHLKDVVKGGIKERFAHLRKMGIRTVMITGDNPQTAAAIAAEAGVDDFIAQATPEAKLKRIRAGTSRGPSGCDDRRRHQ